MSAARPGVLFSQMQPPPERVGEFHEWYETEHIPARMAIPGFAGAQRFEAIEGWPHHLAVYWLDDLGTLETPEYARLKREGTARSERMLGSVERFTRYICELVSDTGAPDDEQPDYLSAVAFSVPEAGRAEFDDWYEDEHIPLLMRSADWLRIRRCRVLSGEPEPWTDLALHELRGPAAMDSEQRAAARAAPKRTALGERPWFASSGRWLYRCIARHRGGVGIGGH